MPRIKGMITEVQQRQGQGKKGPWEMLGVTIEGQTYWGFLPQWSRLRGSEGKWAEVDYTTTERGGLNVVDIAFVPLPPGAELVGPDAKPATLNTQEIDTCWMTATELTVCLSNQKFFVDTVAAEKFQLDSADRAASWMLKVKNAKSV